jgi:hypothetical protein
VTAVTGRFKSYSNLSTVIPVGYNPHARLFRLEDMANNEKPELVKRLRQEIKRDGFHDPAKRKLLREHLLIAGPLLQELADLGYDIDNLDDLRYQERPWKRALPTLLRWLPKIDDPNVKESIVRCLSVPWAGTLATAELIVGFKRYAPINPRPANPWIGKRLRELTQEEKQLGPYFSLAWAIGNALSIVDVRGFEPQITELCLCQAYGRARQMVVLGLGRLDSVGAEEAALDLLTDDDVQLHAIIALGKMKSKRALFQLEPLLKDKRATVRKEARKAITKIMR